VIREKVAAIDGRTLEMSVTTVTASLTTQAADKAGSRIVLHVLGKNLVGLEGSNPERRIVRITRALRKAGGDTEGYTVKVRKAPSDAVSVRGVTGADIATEVFGL